MNKTERILLAHGGGGRLTGELIRDEIVSRFGDGPLQGLPDAATLPISGKKLIFTTDSFVVQPLEFPGGNIGKLSVCGTINDLSVSGGKPEWLSLGMIIEEGLPLATLRAILDGVKTTADDCGVKIVTGDTKVVAKGQCDGIYLNTAGIGEALTEFDLGMDKITPGDKVLVSGPLGDHGIAVMTAREGINISGGPVSDCAPVNKLTLPLTQFGGKIKFMRDPTRGGAAAVLNEIASGRNFGILLNETSIPVSAGTRAAAEMLGLEPMNIACEGRVVAVCSGDIADEVLNVWKKLPDGENAAVIGEVSEDAGRVIMKTLTGGKRLVDVPAGELLPRIC